MTPPSGAVSETVVFPCVGRADPECLFSGMFPRGHLSGQDEAYTTEALSFSPKRQAQVKKGSSSPKVGKTLRRKLQSCLQGEEDNSHHDLINTTCTKTDLNPSGEKRNSGCRGDISTVEEIITQSSERIENEEAVPSSSNVVDHILKELKGINKIQEEISDLRQYLTSVRGSVDEVSCCVDAVLSEIGELYSGASAAPHSSPVLQIPSSRQGSLGRQNAITSLHVSPLLDRKDNGNDCRATSSHRPPKQWHIDLVNLQWNQQTGQKNQQQMANVPLCGLSKPDHRYHELHSGQDCQSPSSLSSCHSSNCLQACNSLLSTQYDSWPSVEMHHSFSGGWSEEDLCSSCANSGEELENCLGVWDRCAIETQSSTPGHSSQNSSEHLSLLFGHHYNSPSSSSSVVDRRPQRLQADEENLDCDCVANCPYSRSSGYHTVDACANEVGSGPSRSLSCSTVLLTDCDDGYLESHSQCDDGLSSGDTLDLGSAESLDKESTDHSIFREDTADSLSQGSSEMLSESTAKSPSAGFDVPTFTKAVLSFRSALKGALKKLDGSNPDDEKVNSASDAALSPVRQSFVTGEEQGSAESTNGEVSLTENHTQFGTPKDESESSVYVSCATEPHETLSLSPQPSPSEPSPSTLTESHSLEISQDKECPTDGELSTLDLTPVKQEESPLVPVPSPLSSDEVRLSPIKENHILDEVVSGKSTDPSHKERIANFQRILREKRQTRHRLSKSAQGSQGSHGSQGSQGSQSQDEFFPEIWKEDNQVILTDCTHSEIILVVFLFMSIFISTILSTYYLYSLSVSYHYIMRYPLSNA
ncbi:uncharacterized protein LOC115429837 [Sphaeramia orbicularis]|uniref:uncharacterized protein LOC115429837 n=1 Tax=Sphaeramia orbicularis TaxID=375764 RepID=UPI00117F9C00|nr:uncharacterized protein LOC115429837 [Sphaeramia orbicularis]